MRARRRYKMVEQPVNTIRSRSPAEDYLVTSTPGDRLCAVLEMLWNNDVAAMARECGINQAVLRKACRSRSRRTDPCVERAIALVEGVKDISGIWLRNGSGQTIKTKRADNGPYYRNMRIALLVDITYGGDTYAAAVELGVDHTRLVEIARNRVEASDEDIYQILQAENVAGLGPIAHEWLLSDYCVADVNPAAIFELIKQYNVGRDLQPIPFDGRDHNGKVGMVKTMVAIPPKLQEAFKRVYGCDPYDYEEQPPAQSLSPPEQLSLPAPTPPPVPALTPPDDQPHPEPETPDVSPGAKETPSGPQPTEPQDEPQQAPDFAIIEDPDTAAVEQHSECSIGAPPILTEPTDDDLGETVRRLYTLHVSLREWTADHVKTINQTLSDLVRMAGLKTNSADVNRRNLAELKAAIQNDRRIDTENFDRKLAAFDEQLARLAHPAPEKPSEGDQRLQAQINKIVDNTRVAQEKLDARLADLDEQLRRVSLPVDNAASIAKLSADQETLLEMVTTIESTLATAHQLDQECHAHHQSAHAEVLESLDMVAGKVYEDRELLGDILTRLEAVESRSNRDRPTPAAGGIIQDILTRLEVLERQSADRELPAVRESGLDGSAYMTIAQWCGCKGSHTLILRDKTDRVAAGKRLCMVYKRKRLEIKQRDGDNIYPVSDLRAYCEYMMQTDSPTGDEFVEWYEAHVAHTETKRLRGIVDERKA